jgi:hypothetical protein
LAPRAALGCSRETASSGCPQPPAPRPLRFSVPSNPTPRRPARNDGFPQLAASLARPLRRLGVPTSGGSLRGLGAPQQADVNDDAKNEHGARTPSSRGKTPRRAWLLGDRRRFAGHTHRISRRSRRPASSVLAQCAADRARATRQHRRQSNGSRPQRCHRRFASRSSQRCHARDALPAPPDAGGHGPDALSVQCERHQG